MELKNKKLKSLKILLITILAIVLVTIALTIGIGNYFVDYAILRSGDGGDREVKNEDVVEVASIDNESEKIIEEKIKSEQELAKEWMESVSNKKVEVKAKDNITLRGTQYFTEEQTNKWAIILHGYRSKPDSVNPIGMHFSEKGYYVRRAI